MFLHRLFYLFLVRLHKNFLEHLYWIFEELVILRKNEEYNYISFLRLAQFKTFTAQISLLHYRTSASSYIFCVCVYVYVVIFNIVQHVTVHLVSICPKTLKYLLRSTSTAYAVASVNIFVISTIGNLAFNFSFIGLNFFIKAVMPR